MQSSRAEREREANEHAERAAALRAAGRPEEALVHADLAVAAVEAITAQDPSDPSAQWVLAGQLYNRAAICEALGEYGRGASDAWRSFSQYQRLADQLPMSVPLRADAQARLARLLVRAGAGAPDVDAGSAREHAAMAVRTYERLAAVDAAHRPGLARVQYLKGEVLRVLDGEGSPVSRAAYAAAVAGYRALDHHLSQDDLHYFADAALRLAHGHAAADAHPDTRDAAEEAVVRLEELLGRGKNVHGQYARALFLLGAARRLLDDPEWEQPLVDAAYVISLLPEPLPDDLAVIRDQISPA